MQCISGWLRTCSVDQAGTELIETCLPWPPMLELKACAVQFFCGHRFPLSSCVCGHMVNLTVEALHVKFLPATCEFQFLSVSALVALSVIIGMWWFLLVFEVQSLLL